MPHRPGDQRRNRGGESRADAVRLDGGRSGIRRRAHLDGDAGRDRSDLSSEAGAGRPAVPRPRRRPAPRHLRQRVGGRGGRGSGTRRHRAERAPGERPLDRSGAGGPDARGCAPVAARQGRRRRGGPGAARTSRLDAGGHFPRASGGRLRQLRLAGDRLPHWPVAVRRSGHLSGGEHGLARRQAGVVRRCRRLRVAGRAHRARAVAQDPAFQEAFVEEMAFPASAG